MSPRRSESPIASAESLTIRILVVDDTEDSRAVTSTFLRLKGFDVAEAATGAEALALAAEQPDLIVLDIALPDMDGFEVCRRLKATSATATIPVLHLSAHRQTRDDRIRGMEEGADAYLMQPADPDELLATVKALLRRRTALQGPAPTTRRSSRRGRTEEAAMALVDVGRELTAATDLMIGTRRAVDTVRRVFRARRSVFYELDRVSSSLVCTASAGDGDVNQWLGQVIPFGEGAVGLAVAEGQPIACADILTDRRVALPADLRERLQHDPCRAIAAVPLVAPGEVLGAWALVDATGRGFTDEELRLLSAFADQIALAIQNARLSQQLERRLQESHGLLRVTQLLNSSLEPSEIARLAAREVTQLLGADTSIFFAVDETSGQAIGIAGYHVPPALWQLDYRVALTDLPLFFREAAATGRPIASDDVLNDPRLNHPAIRTLPELPRSLLCVPVLRNGRVSGALLTYWWTTSHRVSEDGIRLAIGVATQLVLALDNAHLHQREERRRREAEAAVAQAQARLARMRSLAQLSQLVGSSLDIQQVLDFVTSAVSDFLQVDLARVWILDDRAGELRVKSETPKAKGGRHTKDRLPLGAGVVGRVIEQNAPAFCEDILAEPRLVNKAWFRSQGFRSLMAVPLTAGDRAVGALVVLTRSARRFDEEDADLLQIFATKAATALENARLYQAAQQAYQELAQAQDQLVQSQKMEAIGQLAGGIAHDFNNLLTVIQGRSQLLLRSLSGDGRLRRDVEIVSHTADRAAVLTRQLLAFSRRQILQPRVLDVNRVVIGISAMLERVIGEHIVLHLDLAPALGAVRADRGHLEQVITNLCVNARDAQPAGGRVTITTRNVDLADGAYVRLAVSDIGCGMDAATQARIFEPFFTTKEAGKGTGLGLSTVYGIVTHIGGRIGVTSRPGQGSTFEIHLPRVAEALDPDVDETFAEPVGGSETVLLVEDEDEVRTLAREILEPYGYRVLEAKQGEQALELLERHDGPIHLVVTDVVMPAMGGHELSEHVGRTGRGTRMLFISGYPGEMTIPGDVPDAGLFFLAKPFSPRALAEKVRIALDAP